MSRTDTAPARHHTEIEIDTDAEYFCPVCEPDRTTPNAHTSPVCTGYAHPRDRATVSTHPRGPRREPQQQCPPEPHRRISGGTA